MFQADLAIRSGATRIIIANEVVGGPDNRWLANRTADDSVRIIVEVDSPEAATILADGLRAAHAAAPQAVLVEVGHAAGRSGVRDTPSAMRAAFAIAQAPRLSLVGVATYEGVVCHDREPASLSMVDGYLDGIRSMTLTLRRGFFDGLDRVTVSAGGTRFVDRVVERLAPGDWGECQVDLVVRAGCYLLYGSGTDSHDSPFSQPGPFGRLAPAAMLWAPILSLPEPGLAIVGVGKKNVGDRLGSLLPRRLASPARSLVADVDLSVVGLDDQHAYVRYHDVGLQVGDLMGFGLRHPATLDRWRVVPIVDGGGAITDAAVTFFS